MISRTVKAIACWTAGLILTITGAIATVAGLLANANAPKCSFLDGTGCDTQREVVTATATGYIVGGIAFVVVGLGLFAFAAPWLRELDEAAKATEPSES